MFWTIFGLFIFFSAISMLAYFNISDRRARKRSIIESISANVWDELAEERDKNLKKARTFKKILEEKAHD